MATVEYLWSFDKLGSRHLDLRPSAGMNMDSFRNAGLGSRRGLVTSAPQLRSAVLAAVEHVSLITRNSHSEAQ
jgi:hypothetical protein